MNKKDFEFYKKAYMKGVTDTLEMIFKKFEIGEISIKNKS